MMICAKVTLGKVVVLLQVSLLLVCFVLDCLCVSGGDSGTTTTRVQKLNNLRTTPTTSRQHAINNDEEDYYLDLDKKLATFHWKAEPAITVNTNSQINNQLTPAAAASGDQLISTAASSIRSPNSSADSSKVDADGEHDGGAHENDHGHHVHKHMSKQDLRRTFQVDSHDQVPDYVIITVHPRSKHTIRKRSSSSENDDNDQVASLSSNNHQQENVNVEENLDTTTTKTKTNYDRNYINSNNNNKNDNLIVMELPIFGRDYKLRLKRNIEFQQKLHNMPLFMAETTKDGQLRYTEISRSQPATSNNATKQQQQQATSHESPIGSTYHDEENLAALLIDQDTRTGHFRVDGTIGNDFVIKPMPASAIEALESHKRRLQETSSSNKRRRRQENNSDERQKQAAADNKQSKSHNNNKKKLVAKVTDQNQDQAAMIDLKHNHGLTQSSSAAASLASSSRSGGSNLVQIPSNASKQQLSNYDDDDDDDNADQGRHTSRASESSPAATLLSSSLSQQDSNRIDLQRVAAKQQRGPSKRDTAGHAQSGVEHEHDDPHDDDEMFLDEDEALEMAHQRQQQHANLDQHDQSSNTTSQLPQPDSSLNRQLASAGKPTNERKWRKYRKLMAQTKVPKANQQQRSRRHASQQDHQEDPLEVRMTHHIVYRQKPGSGEGHEHSFFALPAEQLRKQHLSMSASGEPTAEQRLATRLVLAQETDQLHDPLGGQFYLEPGLLAGATDAETARSWKLWSRAANLQKRNESSLGDQQDEYYATRSNATHSRQKRHVPPRRLPVVPGPVGPAGRPPHPHSMHGPPMPAGGPMRAQASAQQQSRRNKRQTPDIVYPEVLLVVDYDSFLLHGGDSRDVKRYFVSFWNGVDLRYKLLAHPNIRISLAGMIVAKDRDATPYLERNRLRSPNADAVDAAGALTDMGKYLYREDRLPTYDLAVVITKLDMCRRRFDGGRCNRGTAGFAYVGGACVVNKRLEKVNSVAIIEDSGGFSGIIVAAHEVGHLLGCVHDGSPPPNYLGGPGATHCPWEDGFIMSDLRHTERGFRWSHCSVEQFKHFLHGETATCLYNYPHESQMLHRLLPGTMLSLDEQCKRDRGTNACFKDARVCAQLFCFDSASGYCVSYRPAAEGSPCGEGQSCRNGKCVGDVENIITDYSHQSQTVVSRRAQVGAAPGGISAVVSAASAPAGVAASTASLARVPANVASSPAVVDGEETSSSSGSSVTAIASSTNVPNSSSPGGGASSSIASSSALPSTSTTVGAPNAVMLSRRSGTSSTGASSTTLSTNHQHITNNNNSNNNPRRHNINRRQQQQHHQHHQSHRQPNYYHHAPQTSADPNFNNLVASLTNI